MKKTIFTTLLTVSFASVSFLTGYAQQVISKQDVVITANAVTSQKIIDAIQKPDLKAINKIINDDPDLLKQKLIEISDKEYQPTLLHLAAMEEKTDVLKFLLEKGADPNAKDSENKIPILVAAALNNTEAVLYLAVNGTKDEVLDSCVELPARLKNATDYQEKAEERAAEFELYKVRINNAKRKAQANLKNYFLNTIKKLDMDKFVTQKEFAQKVTEILERGFSGGEIKNLDYDSCFIVLKGNKSITQAFEGYQLYLKDVENKSNVDKIALDEMKKVIENFISKIEAKVIKENTNVLNAYQNNINQNETTFALNTTIEKTIAGLTIKNPFVNNGEPVFLEEKYQLAFKDTEKFGDTKVVSAAGTLSIYNDEFLDKLESQDPTTRNNAIKDLINAGLTAIKKLEGYNFYPKAKQGNQPVLPLNLDKNSETYKALSKVGKYLEYPELEPKLIDLDLHKKALALDKNIIDLLPDVGAKIIIHGTLFGGNPKYDECKFASKEFSDFCNYLKENVEKLDLKSVTYDNHESVVYSAGELVKHARGEGDPFLDHWTGPNISEEKRNILNKGFIFDKIIRSTDSSYTYQKENLRRDQTGVTLARSRISSFTGNDNKYLQYINK